MYELITTGMVCLAVGVCLGHAAGYAKGKIVGAIQERNRVRS